MSLSAWDKDRNLRMVHRFSHRVRFSGLGLSFHLSSSHSQPWNTERERDMKEEKLETERVTGRGRRDRLWPLNQQCHYLYFT